MFELTMSHLENVFNQAVKVPNQNYVAVKIQMEGFAEAEIIINPIRNVKEKLEYYKKTYDENLNHKFADGIKIVAVTFGETMKEIEDDFYYYEYGVMFYE
mgnify:CR=1 FL=1